MAEVVVAFGVALAWSLAALRLGPRLGFVDTPGGTALKVHKRPTPLLGGVGVFGGIQVGLLVADQFSVPLFVASLLVLALGLADDKLDLSPKLRLAAELGAAAVLVALMDSVDSLGGIVFGIALVLVAINAVNLLDGLDGLVGSVTFVSALGLAWAGSEGFGASALGPVLAAAVLGFLALNRPRARIFLGDNGAYMIGLTLAYGALDTLPRGSGSMLLIASGVLGVFGLDLIVTILRRRLSGKPLFAGDRSHVYDQLRDRGWTTPWIDLAAAMTQALFAGFLIGYAIQEAGLGGALLAVLAAAGVSLVLFWRIGFIRS